MIHYITASTMIPMTIAFNAKTIVWRMSIHSSANRQTEQMRCEPRDRNPTNQTNQTSTDDWRLTYKCIENTQSSSHLHQCTTACVLEKIPFTLFCLRSWCTTYVARKLQLDTDNVTNDRMNRHLIRIQFNSHLPTSIKWRQNKKAEQKITESKKIK